MAGQFHAPSHPGVLKNVNMNGNILQRYFIHKSKMNECSFESMNVDSMFTNECSMNVVANIHWRKTFISS